jgi:sugar/nucleoside kinase (ribokinase family)
VGTTAGPASYQAAVSTDRRQNGGGVGRHVHNAAARLGG